MEQPAPAWLQRGPCAGSGWMVNFFATRVPARCRGRSVLCMLSAHPLVVGASSRGGCTLCASSGSQCAFCMLYARPAEAGMFYGGRCTLCGSSASAHPMQGSMRICCTSYVRTLCVLCMYTACPPVATSIMHDIWAVAQIVLCIHKGNCPSSWATAQESFWSQSQSNYWQWSLCFWAVAQYVCWEELRYGWIWEKQHKAAMVSCHSENFPWSLKNAKLPKIMKSHSNICSCLFC